MVAGAAHCSKKIPIYKIRLLLVIYLKAYSSQKKFPLFGKGNQAAAKEKAAAGKAPRGMSKLTAVSISIMSQVYKLMSTGTATSNKSKTPPCME